MGIGARTYFRVIYGVSTAGTLDSGGPEWMTGFSLPLSLARLVNPATSGSYFVVPVRRARRPIASLCHHPI
jgi:hypothetical protein